MKTKTNIDPNRGIYRVVADGTVAARTWDIDEATDLAKTISTLQTGVVQITYQYNSTVCRMDVLSSEWENGEEVS